MPPPDTENRADVGLIGLAVMGENLVLNMADHGFTVAVYNRTVSKVDDFIARNPDPPLVGAHSIPEFVASLKRPRRIILLIKAGKPVDEQMEQLRPHLDPGDLVIDGGNSYFADTERRVEEYGRHGLLFMGMGVSGGEEGARYGPSIMPGGSREAYALIEPIVTRVAAKTDDGACVTYIGPGGSGHYVKMVHNGIEYADMQLIAEGYDILRKLAGADAGELSTIFARWNRGPLQSFLIEITAEIFGRMDLKSGRPLVDLILDAARQKGTGKWTSQNALDLGIPVPTITAAVDARYLSAMKEDRVDASALLPGPPAGPPPADRERLIEQVHEAMYAAKVCCYAQGMALLAAAGSEYSYRLDLSELARIWKGGCIIRARLLDDVKHAFLRRPDLPNLLIDPVFVNQVGSRQSAWRDVLSLAIKAGIPVPALSSSLAYYDSVRSAELPANLIQAQRDFFGAHTYERVDEEGVFHTEWAAET